MKKGAKTESSIEIYEEEEEVADTGAGVGAADVGVGAGAVDVVGVVLDSCSILEFKISLPHMKGVSSGTPIQCIFFCLQMKALQSKMYLKKKHVVPVFGQQKSSLNQL